MNTLTDRLAREFTRRYRARYRHGHQRCGINLYYWTRLTTGKTQKQLADSLGIGIYAWKYRERYKVLYYPLEIVTLAALANVDDVTFMKMLRESA